MPPLSYPSALAYLRSLPSSSSSSNPPTTSLPLLQTLSRSCPHPICASAPGLPPFDNSAMDGYLLDPSLVRSASKTDAVLLRVRGSLAAGDEPLSSSATREEAGDRSEGSEQVQGEEVKGDCWEMMTGAPFPDGEAYTGWGCVKHEIVEVVEGGKYVRIVEPVPERANRRPAGEDYPPASLVLPAYTPITPEHIMVLSSLGLTHVDVLRPLRIGIISTGKELVPSSTPPPLSPAATVPSSCSRPTPPSLARGQIYDSNTPYLLSKLASWGFDPVPLGSTGDSIETFESLLAEHAFLSSDPSSAPAPSASSSTQSPRVDMIITTGAVSQGKHDHVPSSLARLGVEVGFKGVGMRPGGPVMFGRFPRKRPSAAGGGKDGTGDGMGQETEAKEEGGRKESWPPRPLPSSNTIPPSASRDIAPLSNHTSSVPSTPPSMGIPIFGLPGNPQAVAATLRFLVLPYLLHLASPPSSFSPSQQSDATTSSSLTVRPLTTVVSHSLTTPILRKFIFSPSSSTSHKSRTLPPSSSIHPSSSTLSTTSSSPTCPLSAPPSSSPTTTPAPAAPPRRLPTRFFPGRLLPGDENAVELTKGKAGSGMMSGLVGSDRCWVCLEEGMREEEMNGKMVRCWVV